MVAAPTVKVLLLTDDSELAGEIGSVSRLACGLRLVIDVHSCRGDSASGSGAHDVRFVDARSCPERALQLLSRNVSENFTIPTVVITDPLDRVVERRALELGAADCFTPTALSPTRLIRSVRRALEQTVAEKARQRAHLKIGMLMARLQQKTSPSVDRAA